MSKKMCFKCKRELPATNEYFHRSNQGSFGLNAYCKECRGHKFTPIPKEGYIICSTCKQELLANEESFLPRKDSANGFRGVCRKCRSTQETNFRLENLEVMRERDHQQDIKRKDSKKLYAYQRYWTNLEIVSLINKKSRTKHIEKRNSESRARYQKKTGEYKEYAANYRKTESGKVSFRKCKQKRRAIKRKLVHDFTKEQWIACKEHFGNVCAYCGKDTLMNHDLDQEHFVASENNGPYTVSNIVPACRSCNSRKHTFDFFNWYPRQPFYSKQRESKILEYLNIHKSKFQQLSFVN